ncbi:MAG: YIP1 family protein [Chloroflexota bacterium]|nr:YIP1 family protein [Chloroflexota bacterium]
MTESPEQTSGGKQARQLALARWEMAGKPMVLAQRALLMDEQAYLAVREHPNALSRGFVVLLLSLIAVLVARLIGMGLGWLTMPRVDEIQRGMESALTEWTWYANQVAADPGFADQFQQAYDGIWQLVRVATGYPSAAGIGALVTFLVITGISWLLFGLTAHLIARWFGGEASLGQFLGVLALAYTPILLTIIPMIPGASISPLLVFLAILVLKYLAVKCTYGLSPGYGLAIVLLPYLIGLIILTALVLLAVALGLNQIPFVNDILHSLRILGILWG